jgi:hypothetical protein
MYLSKFDYAVFLAERGELVKGGLIESTNYINLLLKSAIGSVVSGVPGGAGNSPADFIFSISTASIEG